MDKNNLLMGVIIANHNNKIVENVENSLNSLVNSILEDGGKIWIQDKNNKDDCFIFNGEVKIGYYRTTTKE